MSKTSIGRGRTDLADLLERIASWQPRVIGVDIYRDRPKPPGTERLAALLARHKEIVWTFKLQEGAKTGDPAAGPFCAHGPRRSRRYRDRFVQCGAARLALTPMSGRRTITPAWGCPGTGLSRGDHIRPAPAEGSSSASATR